MESTTKQRNQSQCREWERQRRNKFNDAINRLGELVKNIYKTNETLSENDMGKTGDNVKYPKIEIVQKAIVCLTNSAQEKTQLKAEILALQVKLEAVKDNKNQKDASTQVFLEINGRNKGIKHTLTKKKPSIILSKSKDLVKIRPAVTIKNKPKGDNVKVEIKAVATKKEKLIAPSKRLPTLVPRCNVFDKEGSENTIVVLPAAPYLFPQRPFLLPSISPAIVVVDHNLQTNKGVPIISRNVGDITKTTMVNILPISAYSRPLSASKQKKTNVKLKANAKKPAKKCKGAVINEIIQSSTISETKPDETIVDCNKESADKPDNNKTNVIVSVSTSDKHEPEKIIDLNVKDKLCEINEHDTVESNTKLTTLDVSTTTDSVVTKSESKTVVNTKSVTTSTNAPQINKDSNKGDDAINKSVVLSENKDKENKLRNILDTTLDNVVDGGNARLELAEEFLAASPTAAFLMSFPLVSGNRADSPADETPNTTQALITNVKEYPQKRNYLQSQSNPATIFEKSNNDMKVKTKTVMSSAVTKTNEPNQTHNVLKPSEPKVLSSVSDNPFLNLPAPTLASTTCSIADTGFGLDFENNIIKPPIPQTTSNNNIFNKNDTFSSAKSTIYSTSSISSNHDFNGIGLYPCAMEKYSKNKSDFTNLDDNNVMKLGSSRLTYDIDLGWSHKGFEFFSCTSGPTFVKDNIATVTSSTTFCTSYNPFNPEFHVPLVSVSSKKDIASSKTNTYVESFPTFYSQHNLWSDDTFYNNTNVSKSIPSKQQNYTATSENVQGISNVKLNIPKHYDIKSNSETNIDTRTKTTNTQSQNQINDKYKKSPSKMHINWMTSEIRPLQSAYNATMHTDVKDTHKITYNHLDHITKRNDHNDANNYFPLSMQMHSFPSQPAQEEFQVWPSARPLGTTEISIDPPINLPTLVGDLALGPHDKKKSLDPSSRTVVPQQDLQNCSNFFSVTHLMNRSSENLPSRYQPAHIESSKPNVTKHNITNYSNDSNRKLMTAPRVENNAQPYSFNNPKLSHSYEHMAQFSHNTKPKPSTKSDKSNKAQKNNYSAESLLRGGSCTQKLQENSSKFLVPPQKYNDFNTAQESGVAQVSHFPSIIDYTDNGYSAQQFSGTSLYNTTTNTLSNSFYTNFMPGSSNLMPSNYASAPFTGEFIDYNQSAECNFTNHKYEELKMRNNPPIFQTEKVPANYKSSRRESAAKHKLDCSKKDSSKKYQSKRAKLNSDVEEWSETSTFWQNKPNRKNANLMPEELPLPNYVNAQMHPQYQSELYNSHLMPSNVQAAGNDRALSGVPLTSRANFNLSTIFPEITMKVQ